MNIETFGALFFFVAFCGVLAWGAAKIVEKADRKGEGE